MKVTDLSVIDFYIKKYPIGHLFSIPVEEGLEVHIYKKGEFICGERKRPERLYFLVEGRVKLVVIHLDGSISLAEYYQAGDVLGELEMLDMRKESQSIEAVCNTVCLALPFSQYKTKLLKDALFLQNLCRKVSEKMLHNVGKLITTQSYPLANRMAAYLLEQSKDGMVNVKLTDLSQYFGVSYRHLCRVLKDFENQGLISRKRGNIHLCDIARLSQMKNEMLIE